MKRQFVTKDISLALREIGFDEECMAYIESPHPDIPILLGYTVKHSNFTKLISEKRYRIAMPTWQQVIDWMRTRYQLHIDFSYSSGHNKYSWKGWDQYHWLELKKRSPRSEGRLPYPYKSMFHEHCWTHKSYEEARYEAVTKTIELLKKSLVALEAYDCTDGSMTFVVSDDPNKEAAIGKNAKLVTTIHGNDWTDCMCKMHEYLKWEPYKPFEETKTTNND